MEEDDKVRMAELAERVQVLERYVAFLDLLAVPGLLVASSSNALRVFCSARDIPDSAAPCYPLEVSSLGEEFRWFRHTEGCDLRFPVLKDIRVHVRLEVLSMVHIREAADFRVQASPELITVGEPSMKQLRSGVNELSVPVTPHENHLASLRITSIAGLDTAGADQRLLGIPFVSFSAVPDAMVVPADTAGPQL